jgi:hypothetical protein
LRAAAGARSQAPRPLYTARGLEHDVSQCKFMPGRGEFKNRNGLRKAARHVGESLVKFPGAGTPARADLRGHGSRAGAPLPHTRMRTVRGARNKAHHVWQLQAPRGESNVRPRKSKRTDARSRVHARRCGTLCRGCPWAAHPVQAFRWRSLSPWASPHVTSLLRPLERCFISHLLDTRAHTCLHTHTSSHNHPLTRPLGRMPFFSRTAHMAL